MRARGGRHGRRTTTTYGLANSCANSHADRGADDRPDGGIDASADSCAISCADCGTETLQLAVAQAA